MVKCFDIMGKIQGLFNKGEIKYKANATPKAPTANVWTVSHLVLPIEVQQEKEKQGKLSEKK